MPENQDDQNVPPVDEIEIPIMCNFPGCTVQTGSLTFPRSENVSMNPADHGIEASFCDEHAPS